MSDQFLERAVHEVLDDYDQTMALSRVVNFLRIRGRTYHEIQNSLGFEDHAALWEGLMIGVQSFEDDYVGYYDPVREAFNSHKSATISAEAGALRRHFKIAIDRDKQLNSDGVAS